MPDKTPAQTQAEVLLQVADRDWEAARTLAQHSPHLYESIGFHCQQAAEKYLKAALYAHGLPAPFIHDLPSLITMLASRVAFNADDVSAATILTVFAVRLRYEYDDSPDFAVVDLLAMAQRFRDKLRPLAAQFLI